MRETGKALSPANVRFAYPLFVGCERNSAYDGASKLRWSPHVGWGARTTRSVRQPPQWIWHLMFVEVRKRAWLGPYTAEWSGHPLFVGVRERSDYQVQSPRRSVDPLFATVREQVARKQTPIQIWPPLVVRGTKGRASDACNHPSSMPSLHSCPVKTSLVTPFTARQACKDSPIKRTSLFSTPTIWRVSSMI